jgi:DNA-binding winged helix-turn-helix (wHTH) protein/tetratricopeptide (TPR) repeat protein
MSPGQKYEFGKWRLDPAEHLLLRNGKPVALTPKVFETLVVLVENAGRLVPKDECVKRVWPDTFVDDLALAKNISQLRKLLGNGHGPVIETVPKLGYRLLAPVRVITVALETSGYAEAAETRPSSQEPKGGFASFAAENWKNVAVGVVVLIVIGLGFRYYAHRRVTASARHANHDAIVIADFSNRTGDPIFDDTLQQALAIKLGESPFLNIVSGDRIRDELRLMARSPEEKLTSELARQVCQRLNATAMVAGSIAPLGSEYVIGLDAVECQTGRTLAREQVQNASKERALNSLARATSALRSELGESLSSMQRFNTPMNQATTPSLEALKAYSLAWKASEENGETAALPFLKEAIERDPKFAMAYARMGIAYANLGQAELAHENLHKAYELVDNVSERERFYIRSRYYAVATGELEKAIQVFEAWQEVYPDDTAIYSPLGATYSALGNYRKALEAQREALRLEPDDPVVLANLGITYMSLDRLDEAQRVYQHAESKNLQTEALLQGEYQLAFLNADVKRMRTLMDAVSGKPGVEDVVLAEGAATEAYRGHFRRSRELTRQAVDKAEDNDNKEVASIYLALAALYEAEVGNRREAREYAGRALNLGKNRNVEAMSALGLARARDLTQAEKLAAGLDRDWPLHTLQQGYWSPAICAAAELERNHPKSAVDALSRTAAYELSQPAEFNVPLYPIYLRGEALLKLRDGDAAAVEFQKLLDHRGLVATSPLGSLATLGLARSYALHHDSSKAAAAYKQFLTTWKDADLDIPILKEAKAEYAKLQ